ncbi:MAG TPA: hypothetical protein VHU81_10820 [Thermoanaerobaculia bacterium]|jgi:hypothetical protein|nr:hypothetical protein [Thermoanaerobaculia bacterium]
MDHISPEVLLRFVDGHATREEVRSVVRHLLAGCAECGRALHRPYQTGCARDERAYDEVFDRCLNWIKQRKS